MKIRMPLVIGIVAVVDVMGVSAAPVLRVPQASAKVQRLFPGNTNAIFRAPDSMTVYLIHDHGPSTGDTFQGYAVDKKATVINPVSRRLIVSGIYRGIDDPNAAQMTCFNPRYGIQAVKGTSKVNLIICFHCGTINMYSGNQHSSAAISDTGRYALDLILH